MVRMQNSRPLSDSTVSMRISAASPAGRTSSLSRCTAVIGSLLVYSGAQRAGNGSRWRSAGRPCRHLQDTGEEGVDGHQAAGVRRLDVAFAELRREALEQPYALVREVQRALGGGLVQAQQPVVLGQQAVTHPPAANAAGRHLQPSQPQLLLDP